MAAGFEAADGDVIAFLDADVENTAATAFVTGLLGPLLTSEEFVLVKGFYQRPVHGEPDRRGPGHRAGGPADHRSAVPRVGGGAPTPRR